MCVPNSLPRYVHVAMGLELSTGVWWTQHWVHKWKQWFFLSQKLSIAKSSVTNHWMLWAPTPSIIDYWQGQSCAGSVKIPTAAVSLQNQWLLYNLGDNILWPFFLYSCSDSLPPLCFQCPLNLTWSGIKVFLSAGPSINIYSQHLVSLAWWYLACTNKACL